MAQCELWWWGGGGGEGLSIEEVKQLLLPGENTGFYTKATVSQIMEYGFTFTELSSHCLLKY